MAKTKQTRKILRSRKVVGASEYIDPRSGELMPCLMTEEVLSEKDFNFTKFWISQYFDAVEEITNKKRKLADWLIEHRDRENKICYTFRQMAAETGFSLDTVSKTMKALIDAGLIIRINQGCYMINPDIIWKGGTTDRLAVVQIFSTRGQAQEQAQEQGQAQEQEQTQEQEQEVKADGTEPPESGDSQGCISA